MRQFLETEKAYLAGIIDGEGTITFAVSRPHARSRYVHAQPTVAIINTNSLLIEHLVTLLGIGKTYVMPKYGFMKKPAWRIQIHKRREVLDLLVQILPFLIVKRPQAEKVIEFCTSRLAKTPDHTNKVKWPKLSEHELDLARQVGILNGGKPPSALQ